MRIADTSWLYALLNHDDPHHQDAVEQAQDSGPIGICDPILSEFLTLLEYRFDADTAQAAATGLAKTPNIRLHAPADGVLALHLWREQPGIDVADAFAIAAALAAKGALLTFDRRQAAAHAAAD